jgi:transcriptional regulator with XRE-family HTH domain
MEPGNRLRLMRKAAGLTQTQLAELTGVSQPAISQLENGTLEMSFSWARTFARVLNCAFVDLIPDEDAEGVIRDERERLLIERYRKADAGKRHDLEAVAAALVPLPANGPEGEPLRVAG